MVEPLSIATAATGFTSFSLQLLGGCIKGFILLSKARNLGKDASTIICMLNIEEIQLTDWAQRAGLLGSGDALDRRLNAAAVEETLQQLQDLLLNTENLKKRYALTLLLPNNGQEPLHVSGSDADSHDTKRVFTAISDERRKQVLTRAKVIQGEQNVFKKFWWAAVDKEKIEKFVRH